MIQIIDKTKCCGCSACKAVCPKNAITMVADTEGFLYPKVDESKCIKCGLCNKVCPCQNLHDKNNFINLSFACKNNDEVTRSSSSSGGVFSLLAEAIIEQQGVVFGAAFDEQFVLRHSYAETIEDYQKFRGSKYLQSEIGESYRQVKNFLEQGRWVMFTGTPCQIDGLQLFLRKKYSHLLLVDVVCHGTPSPKVFAKYMVELQDDIRKKIQFSSEKTEFLRIEFRDKTEGWQKFSFLAEVRGANRNSVFWREILTSNIFMRGFLANLYLRPSCHHCSAYGLDRVADLSLADYWGIDSKYPEMNDDKGTSLVLVNSEKGKVWFDKIASHLTFIPTDLEHAISNNPCIIKSVAPHPKRDEFFANLDKEPLEVLVPRLLRVPFLARLKNVPYRVLRKFGLIAFIKIFKGNEVKK